MFEIILEIILIVIFFFVVNEKIFLLFNSDITDILLQSTGRTCYAGVEYKPESAFDKQDIYTR